MAENLRDFRRKVSVLKKQGLLPSRSDSGSKLDARSVVPSWKVKGKSLSTLVKKYDDVASGKASALPVSKSQLGSFRKAGFETAQGKVIVPHAATESARIIKGQVSIKNKSGMERVQIPLEYHNVPQYLRDLRKNRKLINQMKRDNEYFGIRFYGGQRANFYSDINSLIREFSKYDAVRQAHSRFKQAEVYKHLEIIKFTRTGAEKLERELTGKRSKMSKAYNRKRKKKFMEKLKGKPAFKRQQYRDMNAEAQANYRRNLTGSALKKYKAAARKRAKKSRKKRSGKK